MGRMRPRRNYPNRGQGRAGQRKLRPQRPSEWYERTRFEKQRTRGRKKKRSVSTDWDWENRRTK